MPKITTNIYLTIIPDQIEELPNEDAQALRDILHGGNTLEVRELVDLNDRHPFDPDTMSLLFELAYQAGAQAEREQSFQRQPQRSNYLRGEVL